MIKKIDLYKENIKKSLSCNDLSKINNCSILVTGASGMIGSAIVDALNMLNELNSANIKIFAGIREFHNIPARFNNYENLTCVQIDVLKPITLEEKVDYIINCASNSDPKYYAQSPVQTLLGNVIGTQNIMEFALKTNAKRAVYISSGEVYGEDRRENVEFFDEEYIGNIDSTLPRSCYPIGKKAAETLMVSYSKQYEIESVIVRPCHVYGPTQTDTDNRAASAFIRNAIEQKDIIMKSEGKQIRTYVYTVDCAVGILMAMQSGDNMNAYNVSNNDATISIADFAKTIQNHSNSKVIFELPTNTELQGYTKVTRACLDSKKLMQKGFTPCFGIEDGIKNTLAIMQ